MLRTIVYIDGLNFYYGAVRKTPYKWVDLRKLCERLLPRNHIVKIKYFTSRVLARPGQPDPPLRQQAYLRALRTLPEFETYFGHFLSHRVRMPVSNPHPHPLGSSRSPRRKKRDQTSTWHPTSSMTPTKGDSMQGSS